VRSEKRIAKTKAIATCLEENSRFQAHHVSRGKRRIRDGPLHLIDTDWLESNTRLNLTSVMPLQSGSNSGFFKIVASWRSILNWFYLAFSPSPKYFVNHAYAAAKSCNRRLTVRPPLIRFSKYSKIKCLSAALVESSHVKNEP